jgi:multidrug resistance efflux pump
VQRVPVKIVLDGGQPKAERLRPGLSVIATVRTNGAGQ